MNLVVDVYDAKVEVEKIEVKKEKVKIKKEKKEKKPSMKKYVCLKCGEFFEERKNMRLICGHCKLIMEISVIDVKVKKMEKKEKVEGEKKLRKRKYECPICEDFVNVEKSMYLICFDCKFRLV